MISLISLPLYCKALNGMNFQSAAGTLHPQIPLLAMGYMRHSPRSALETSLPASNFPPAASKNGGEARGAGIHTGEGGRVTGVTPEPWRLRRKGEWALAYCACIHASTCTLSSSGHGAKMAARGGSVCHPYVLVPCKSGKAFCPLLRVCHENKVTVARGSSGTREQCVLKTTRIHMEGAAH